MKISEIFASMGKEQRLSLVSPNEITDTELISLKILKSMIDTDLTMDDFRDINSHLEAIRETLEFYSKKSKTEQKDTIQAINQLMKDINFE